MAPEIFHIEEDTSMRVHLLDGCVDNADKVAERVKSHGGSICSKARYADVILVNPDQGDSVPAEFRSTPLLDPRWIKKCIKAGRALMEEDNWAGCLVVPSQDAEPNPQVPTPRITPDQYGPRQTSPNNAVASGSGTMMPFPNQYPGGPNTPFMNGAQNMAMMAMGNPGMQFPTDPVVANVIWDMITMGNAGFNGFPNQAANPMFPTSASAPALAAGGAGQQQEQLHARSASADTVRAQPASAYMKEITPDAPVDVSSILKGLTFYVQLALSLRVKIVADIKAMGGKVTTDTAAANFLVLAPRTRDTIRILKSAHDANWTAVGVEFVRDCLEKGRLLPPAKYTIQLDGAREDSDEDMATANEDEDMSEDDTPLSQRPRAKKRKSDVKDEAAKKKAKLEASPPRGKKTEPVASAKAKATAAAAKRNASPLKADTSTWQVKPKAAPPTAKRRGRLPGAVYDRADRSPSPVPPPPSTWRPLDASNRDGSVKYRYTPEEEKFMEEYVFHLRKYDPNMSRTMITRKLAKKLPNHSEAGWGQALSSRLNVTYENALKRAAIYHRKIAAEGRDTPSKQSPAITPVPTQPTVAEVPQPAPAPGPAAAPAASAPAAAPGPSAENPSPEWEEDMAIVVRFFAHEGGDENEGQEPEQVWHRLEERIKCKTAPSWAAFYDKHNAEILRRYDKETQQEE